MIEQLELLQALVDSYKLGLVVFDPNDENLVEYLAVKDARRCYLDSKAKHMETIRQVLKDIAEFSVR